MVFGGEGVGGGRSRGLHSGVDARSVWLRDLANVDISRGCGKWCPTYAESEQASLHSTEGTRQPCGVFF